MPAVTPNSPSEFTPFASEEEHVRAHRGLETAIESVATGSDSQSFNTVSTLVLIANRVGFGGAVPTTSSTAAPIKGIFRTAATVNVAVPSMSTTSAIQKVFSVETQVGNAIQPGDPVMVLPAAAWPATVVQGNAYCTDTNSITLWWECINGINATTTVAVHVFTFDTT